MANLIRRRTGSMPAQRRGGSSGDWFSPQTLRREIDELFEDFFSLAPSSSLFTGGLGMESGFTPSVDVVERDNQLLMRVDLPGLSEKDIHVDVDDDNVLTIRGEKTREESTEDRGYVCSEREYGSFVRAMQLPNAIDASHIDAEFKNGVLELHIPKAAQSRSREVPIGKQHEETKEMSGDAYGSDGGQQASQTNVETPKAESPTSSQA